MKSRARYQFCPHRMTTSPLSPALWWGFLSARAGIVPEQAAAWHSAKWLHAIEGLITAFATFAIAVFTWTLWRSTDELRKAGDRQAELTQILERAYLAVEPLGINPFVSEDGHSKEFVVGHVNVVNVGRLPAQ